MKNKKHQQAKKGEPSRFSAVAYRLPLPVTKMVQFPNGDTNPICPRCDRSFEREYQLYCDCCGQHLGWRLYDFAAIEYAPRKNGKKKSFGL